MSPFAVYVHIPFCTVKCGYCDFNAYAGLDGLKPAYGNALLREVEAWRPLLEGRRVTSISFGGGTPGEFAAPALAAVIEAIRGVAWLDPNAEVSLEANPGTLTAGYLAGLRAVGVTRLSLGAQSFDAGELRFLDRIHSPQATEAAVGLARAGGFESVSLDLIYGIPGQTLRAWRATLGRALSLAPDHLSCYALTVEEGTPLARRVAAGQVAAPDPDVAADQYELTRELLAAAGYRHYELSNWARPGHESRHNVAYWTDREYLGLGAGAHGYLARDGRWVRYENVAAPAVYIAALSGPPASPAAGVLPSPAIADAYEPDRNTAIADWLETALRLVDGFAPEAFATRFGVSLDATVGAPLRECEAAGLLEEVEGRVRLTARGQSLHSEVVVRVMGHVEGSRRYGRTAAT